MAPGAECLPQPLMQGQDPAVVMQDGDFHLVQSDGCNIRLRRGSSWRGLMRSSNPVIFSPGCREVWAPEIHWLDDRWYVYYTVNTDPATGGRDRRGFVAESVGTSPYGPYQDRGMLFDGYWNIDGSVFTWNDNLYYLFSGEPTPGQQRIFIAPMSNPYTLSGEPVLLSTPTEGWETIGDPDVNEGPWGFRRGRRLFIVYSASGCWTDDYALGLLTLEGSDPLDAGSWTKTGPVFARAPGAYGPGHNAMVADGLGQWWNVYHANNNPGEGCGGFRQIRAQRVSWTAAGLPDFGTPVPVGSLVVDDPDFLVAGYPLDETAGALAAAAGCGDAGAVIGGAVWADPGITLNGVDACVDCGAALGNDVQHALTLAAWVSPASFRDWAGIVTKGVSASPYAMQTWGDGTLRFTANWGRPVGGVGEGSWNSSGGLTIGEWQHVAVTYDGTRIRFYRNGVSDANQPVAALRFGVVDEPLVIGADFPGDDEYFDGAVRDARVYGRALSTQEVLAIANPPPMPQQPVLDNPAAAGGSFLFDAAGDPGLDYEIWSSSNLVSWTLEFATNPVAMPLQVVVPEPIGPPYRFYRLEIR
jgi:GH43 family beta-xylosidase